MLRLHVNGNGDCVFTDNFRIRCKRTSLLGLPCFLSGFKLNGTDVIKSALVRFNELWPLRRAFRLCAAQFYSPVLWQSQRLLQQVCPRPGRLWDNRRQKWTQAAIMWRITSSFNSRTESSPFRFVKFSQGREEKALCWPRGSVNVGI